MTDKEKIRAKVKRRKDELHHLPFTDENLGKINAYEFVLKIIDSLQEEPVNEDLEEAAKEKYGWANDKMYLHIFKEGANWQKQQMMKDAIEREVKIDAGGYPYIDCNIEFWDYDKDVPLAKRGDRYKIILIKED